MNKEAEEKSCDVALYTPLQAVVMPSSKSSIWTVTITGRKNKKINGSKVIWDFFQGHPR